MVTLGPTLPHDGSDMEYGQLWRLAPRYDTFGTEGKVRLTGASTCLKEAYRTCTQSETHSMSFVTNHCNTVINDLVPGPLSGGTRSSPRPPRKRLRGTLRR